MALATDVFEQFCPAFERLPANVALCFKDDDKPYVKIKRRNDQKRAKLPVDTGAVRETKKKKERGRRARN